MISQTTPDGFEARRGARGRPPPPSGRSARARRRAARAAGRRGRAGRGRARVESAWIATWIVWLRSAAEMPVVTPSRASTETVNAVPSGASLWSVIGRSAELVGALLGQAEADQAARVRRHEVDRLGRRELRRDRQVALVLAVRVVDDDDHPALADVLDRLLDRRERRGDGHPDRLAGEQLLDVLREHVRPRDSRASPGLRARRASSPASVCGISATAKPVVVERGDGQARALHGDRALLDDVAEQPPGRRRTRCGGRRPPARPTRTVPTPSTWPWT